MKVSLCVSREFKLQWLFVRLAVEDTESTADTAIHVDRGLAILNLNGSDLVWADDLAGVAEDALAREAFV